MARFTAPIVGMHFRPPAKDIVNCLPGGAELLLEAQPDNPYDPDAVRVMLFGFCKDGQHEKVFAQIADLERENGHDPDGLESRLSDPQMLGFVANSEKTGGKFASEVVKILTALECPTIPAKLTFSESGSPAIEIDVPDEIARRISDEATQASQDEATKKMRAAQNFPPNQHPLDDEIPF